MIAVCKSHNKPYLIDIPLSQWTGTSNNPEHFVCFRKWAVSCGEPGCGNTQILYYSKRTNEITWALESNELLHVPPECEPINKRGRVLTFGSQILELKYNDKGTTPHDSVCEPTRNPSSSDTKHITVAGFKPHEMYTIRCARHRNAYLTIVHDIENNQCAVTGTSLNGEMRLDKIDKNGKIYRFHGKEVKISYNDGSFRASSLYHHMQDMQGSDPFHMFGHYPFQNNPRRGRFGHQ